ncbi:hypothetical protein MSMTP_0587 [Methanosarcina sp. MTP4]|uniref:hypothetical protein n=1 Tax=Methanosarcina sp. MTP4 TaxID=1434100 RepID=UPI00061555FB|nr:hypothetical protein [Methanosarcina sp. MTP4]AKB24056.1 hypothetical protein MSMTP_0587 [Methanosarcina sp. MTP4]
MGEGMKSQVAANKDKKRMKTQVEGDSQVSGSQSKSYYLDVVFIQVLLLLLLYGVCVLVVPKLS